METKKLHYSDRKIIPINVVSAGFPPWVTESCSLLRRAISPFSRKLWQFLQVDPFQPTLALHIETSHLFCRAKSGQKWVKDSKIQKLHGFKQT